MGTDELPGKSVDKLLLEGVLSDSNQGQILALMSFIHYKCSIKIKWAVLMLWSQIDRLTDFIETFYIHFTNKPALSRKLEKASLTRWWDCLLYRVNLVMIITNIAGHESIWGSLATTRRLRVEWYQCLKSKLEPTSIWTRNISKADKPRTKDIPRLSKTVFIEWANRPPIPKIFPPSRRMRLLRGLYFKLSQMI